MKKLLNFLAVMVIALCAFTFVNASPVNPAEKSDMNKIIIVGVSASNVGTVAAQVAAANFDCGICIVEADESTGIFADTVEIAKPEVELAKISELILQENLKTNSDNHPPNKANTLINLNRTFAPVEKKTRFIKRE